jgi:hypothetical protein
MPKQTKTEAQRFLGTWTLILGEVNTGKTTLTGDILSIISPLIAKARLAVIDLAPVVPAHITLKLGLSSVGGHLNRPESKKGLYLTAQIDPPRLSTDSEEAAAAVAGRNRIKIEKLLQIFSKSRRDVLFINDVSLYLQAGKARDLIRYLNPVDTLVVNGYFGEKLGQGLLSQREHREMKALMPSFSQIIRTPVETYAKQGEHSAPDDIRKNRA